MLPIADGAGAFEQLRQHREDRRRVAAGRRRLAGRQADLALGEGQPGDAVHHQQHVAAAVAKPLGDPGGDEGRPQPHHRRLVGGGDHDDRVAQAVRAEVVLEELAHLAAAFADEGDDLDLGLRPAADHRQQARLADAAAGEDAHPLTAADRDQRVDRPHAQREGLVDPVAGHRVGRGRVDAHRLEAGRAAAIRPAAGRARPARGRAAARRRRSAAADRSPCTRSPAPMPLTGPSGRQVASCSPSAALDRDDLGQHLDLAP